MSKKLQGRRRKQAAAESKGKRKRKKEFCLLSLSLSLLSSSPPLSFWLLNYRNGASPPSPPASPLSRRGRGRGRSTCCCGRGCSCSLTRGASRPRSIEKKEKPTLFFNSSAATDAARTSRSLPASQALPLHLGVPVDRKQQSRAWRSKLKEPCSPHRAKGSLLFLVPQPQRNHQKNLLPTRRARALVLGQGRALSIIRPKRAR